MRLTPLQIDMRQLCGEWIPFVESEELSLTDRLSRAHKLLVEETGKDFGYEVSAWHEFLMNSNEYTWAQKHEPIAFMVQECQADPKWLTAVRHLEAAEGSSAGE